MKAAFALIAVGLVLLWYGAAKADWQVQEWSGAQWAPAVTPKGNTAISNVEKTACELDLASLSTVKPAGTRLRCGRVKRRIAHLRRAPAEGVRTYRKVSTTLACGGRSAVWVADVQRR